MTKFLMIWCDGHTGEFHIERYRNADEVECMLRLQTKFSSSYNRNALIKVYDIVEDEITVYYNGKIVDSDDSGDIEWTCENLRMISFLSSY